MQTVSAREPHDRRQSPRDRLGVLLRAISDGVLLPRVGDAVSFSDHLHEGPNTSKGRVKTWVRWGSSSNPITGVFETPVMGSSSKGSAIMEHHRVLPRRILQAPRPEGTNEKRRHTTNQMTGC